MKMSEDKVLREMIKEYEEIIVYIAKNLLKARALSQKDWTERDYKDFMTVATDISKYSEQITSRGRFISENKWSLSE